MPKHNISRNKIMSCNKICQSLTLIIMDISRHCHFKIRGILLDCSLSLLNRLSPSRPRDNDGISFFWFNTSFGYFSIHYLKQEQKRIDAGTCRWTSASSGRCRYQPVDTCITRLLPAERGGCHEKQGNHDRAPRKLPQNYPSPPDTLFIVTQPKSPIQWILIPETRHPATENLRRPFPGA
jgi:hypothetical protein